MSNLIKIVECPRDAWQGLPGVIPAVVKAEYLRRLVDVGFRHIDAVSFVSPAAVPQMADSEEVLEDLTLEELALPDDVEIIGIVVNQKGAERAIDTGAVQTLGFPYSISARFLERNQKQTPEDALDTLEVIATLAENAGLGVVAYISMAFGNPYGEPWSVDEVLGACDLLVESGVQQISLADTVGLAMPQQIAEVVGAARKAHNQLELGVHLHARRTNAAAKIRAAFEAGCTRFDGAIGGLGGCPFAQDALVGNIPTEILIATLNDCGAKLPELGPLGELNQASTEIARRFGPVVQ